MRAAGPPGSHRPVALDRWPRASSYGRAAGVALGRALHRRLRAASAREGDARLAPQDLAGLVADARLLALTADPPSAEGVALVATDVGNLMLHLDDQVMRPIIQAAGCWESDEADWLRRVLRPGDVMVDCGANIGYFSVLASGLVGPTGLVVAIEPEARNLALLRMNLWRNGCDNVRVLPVAAAARRGAVALRRSTDNAGDHRVHAAAQPGDVWVPCLPLDDVLGGIDVRAIKIDVQGTDHEVIAGLAATLAANPATEVLVEFWPDGLRERDVEPADVLRSYRGLGRAIGLLRSGGAVTTASDAQIMALVRSEPGAFANLVLRPSAGAGAA